MRVIVNEDTSTTPSTDEPDYLPMDAGDNAVIRFFGYLCTSDVATAADTISANDTCEDTDEDKGDFKDLSGTSLVS